MRIHSAVYFRSALRPEDYPKDGRPEIAFVGRSNVGKSSLLNALLNRKGLAKTSATPGKTQTINFFTVNDAFYCVDLPGYGFAKVPPALKAEWNRVMHDYLTNRPPLRMAAALLDARHPPAAHDLDMLALLEEAEVPTLIIATKFDKLRPSERQRCLNAIRDGLGLDAEAEVLPFSSVTGQGVKELRGILGSVLG